MLGMGSCRCRVERQVDVVDQLEEARKPEMGGGVAALERLAQALGLGIDARHPHQLERRAPLDLDHQIGADVPGPDDRDAESSSGRAHATAGEPLRRRAPQGSGTPLEPVETERLEERGAPARSRSSRRSRDPDVGASVTPCMA